VKPVTFHNGSVRLAGKVYLPKTGDRLPGLVVLHAAGVPLGSMRLYQHLRDGLPALGVAVLVFDRRGTGGSTGDPRTSGFESLADDAIAAQRALAKVARVDSKRIGFWGLSQGGWLAVLAAARSKDAAFAISVSAPLTSPAKQMEFATANLLRVRGYSPADVTQMLAARRAWSAYLRGTESRAAAVAALTAVEHAPWFDVSYLPAPSQLPAAPKSSSAAKQLDYDPVAPILSTKVPMLFIFGGRDPWVPVDESVTRLKALGKTRPGLSCAVVDGASHEMMFVPHETMNEDRATLARVAPDVPEYFMLLSSWLERFVLTQ
jgi:pimeloyl-ACP methyl ester carboxylesterase